jgi:hypothetical protein
MPARIAIAQQGLGAAHPNEQEHQGHYECHIGHARQQPQEYGRFRSSQHYQTGSTAAAKDVRRISPIFSGLTAVDCAPSDPAV